MKWEEAYMIAKDLEHAREKLASYKAKPPYKTRDRGSFGWGAEIEFWQNEVDRISEKLKLDKLLSGGKI